MITYDDFKSGIVHRLDSGDGTNYFSDEQSYIPAFNVAVNWITSAITRAFETNKISLEALEELRVARVFRTSDSSRINITDYWFVESVNPLPMTRPTPSTANIPTTTPEKSILMEDFIHLYSHYSCKRLTKEEWEINAKNPFASGNILQKCFEAKHGSDKFVLFGYLPGVIYSSDNSFEIEVRPYIPLKLCTVFYVKRPTVFTIDDLDNSDTVGAEFHPKLLPLLVEKALYYISYEQGDGPSTLEVTEAEVEKVVQILS